MYLTADSIDDLLRVVFERFLRRSLHVKATRGPTIEISGVLLKLRNPRIRLSRSEVKGTVFSCLGELLWYLAGSNRLKFIAYYLSRYVDESDDGKTIGGAYGPRLFGLGSKNQVANILSLLRANPSSRRAVIQLFDASDLVRRSGRYPKEVPCTCTLQFLVRIGRLHMFTSMRSNDAYKGLPHDVFCFTMLQEIIARTLGLELGTYSHAVGSLHLYENDIANAQRYLKEGWYSKIPMEPLPRGDPWPHIRKVLQAEARIRNGGRVDLNRLLLPPYWADFVRLLQIFQHTKIASAPGTPKQARRYASQAVARLKKQMHSKTYAMFISKKQSKIDQPPRAPEQISLANL